MNYLKAVLKNDTALEKKYLKNIIIYGKQLKYDVSKYEKELTLIEKSINKKQSTSLVKKVVNKQSQRDLKYSILDVYTKENMIIIDFNKSISKKDIDYNINKTKYSNIYLFDIKGFFKDAQPTKLKIGGVDKIYIMQKNSKLLHIKIEDKNKLQPIYIIGKKRIIIKFLNIKIEDKKQNSTLLTKLINRYKSKIVVIDPGHGGKDSGAIGSKKKYEKNVVLAVSKYLYNHLKKRGYKVFLTRKKDTFITLRDRTAMANDKDADIFISIHANAVQRSSSNKIKGVETFFLSPSRSLRAKKVAARENSVDIRKMSISTQKSFLTVLNRSKITASNKLAIDIQQNILYQLQKKYTDIIDGGVREGPFWVLVGAQMPSILVELGYISNPIEGERLYNKKYQQILAEGIANGIDSYFLKNP